MIWWRLPIIITHSFLDKDQTHIRHYYLYLFVIFFADKNFSSPGSKSWLQSWLEYVYLVKPFTNYHNKNLLLLLNLREYFFPENFSSRKTAQTKYQQRSTSGRRAIASYQTMLREISARWSLLWAKHQIPASGIEGEQFRSLNHMRQTLSSTQPILEFTHHSLPECIVPRKPQRKEEFSYD